MNKTGGYSRPLAFTPMMDQRASLARLRKCRRRRLQRSKRFRIIDSMPLRLPGSAGLRYKPLGGDLQFIHRRHLLRLPELEFLGTRSHHRDRNALRWLMRSDRYITEP